MLYQASVNGMSSLPYVMLMTEGACDDVDGIGGVDGSGAWCRRSCASVWVLH